MHNCPLCDCACYCNGDVDDSLVIDMTGDICTHCADNDDPEDDGDPSADSPINTAL
jgi:hypothetical protein